jgi:sigma-54 dependent transcriptional regulator, acetoin dehydrogenase operon transcriptional activator AcoR
MTTASAVLTSPSLNHEKRTRGAWDRFVRHGELVPNTVRTLVEDSWRRCYRAGVDPTRMSAAAPLPQDELRVLRQCDSELVEASMPIMAEARDFLSESGTIMLLTNPTGVVLQTEGDPATLDAAEKIRLMTATNWNELDCGTNAIGTALSADGPVQIHAAEHFCAGIRDWTCTATVVRDPEDRTVLGALDVSGLKGAFNEHLLPLVVAAAGRVETELAAREIERRKRLLELGLEYLPKIASGGLILFDRKGRVVKADARAGLTLSAIGVDLSVKPRLRVGALDLSAAKGADEAGLPDWLRPEWLEPAIDDHERLGTIAVLPEQFRRSAVLPEGSLPRYKLTRVVEYIEAHIDQTIRLEQLAQAAGVSPFHFHRQFKRSTGSTPHQYIVHKRIERAKTLLSRSDIPLVEVAAQVGFTDQSHFTTAFRRVTSMTPRSYRNATAA